MITERTIYNVAGQDFPRLRGMESIEQHIENVVGKMIDLADVTLTPTQKLKLFSALVEDNDNRAMLVRMLDLRTELLQMEDSVTTSNTK